MLDEEDDQLNNPSTMPINYAPNDPKSINPKVASFKYLKYHLSDCQDSDVS